jgi:nascent polypeptide-associated complex subunit alpha
VLPVNLRELRRMLKRYGVEVEELQGVKGVTISAEDYEIVIRDPQVAILNLGQQKVVQIVCSSLERVRRGAGEAPRPVVAEEDVEFVVEQTGVSREEAARAIAEAGGDVARAIMILQERRSRGS